MPYKNLGRKALLRIKQNTKAALKRRLFDKYVNNPAAIALALKFTLNKALYVAIGLFDKLFIGLIKFIHGIDVGNHSLKVPKILA